jgi:hypothetical protein
LTSVYPNTLLQPISQYMGIATTFYSVGFPKSYYILSSTRFLTPQCLLCTQDLYVILGALSALRADNPRYHLSRYRVQVNDPQATRASWNTSGAIHLHAFHKESALCSFIPLYISANSPTITFHLKLIIRFLLVTLTISCWFLPRIVTLISVFSPQRYIENSPLFPQFCALILQLHEQFETRERYLIQELRNNRRFLDIAGDLIRQATIPGAGGILPCTWSNIIRFLIHHQEGLFREIRRLQWIQYLFFWPSDPLSTPCYTHIELFNHRVLFLEQIVVLQQRVDNYEVAVDTALEVLSETWPPSSPSYFLQLIPSRHTDDEEYSPSLNSSSETGSQNPP